MANKKVSQLTSKPSVLVTDLFPIADPTTGQLFKTTISDLGTAIGSGVSSVNTLVGAVILDTDDIQELVSPTNKWYTDTRSRAALSASSPLVYNSGTGAFSIQVANASQNGYLSQADWIIFNAKQTALSGTGFVKISGTTISYDNSTYLTTSAAASTYLALAGGTLTGPLNGTSANFSGDLTLTGTNPRFYLTDSDNNPDYFISNTDGTFTIYDVTSSTARLTIGTTGNGTFGGNLTVGQIIRSGGTSAQFLKADGSVDSTSYQAALTNPVTGTGTSGILPKFTGASTIGNSQIYDNGTRVSIGADVTTSSRFVSVSSTSGAYAIIAQGSSGANGIFSTVSTSGEIFRGQNGSGAYYIIDNNANTFLSGNLNVGDFASTSYRLNVVGTGNFTGALSGTSATFSGAINLTGTANSFQVASIFRNANRVFFGGDTGGYFFQNSANSATVLQIADSGAATFSSSVTAGSSFLANTASVVNYALGSSGANFGQIFPSTSTSWSLGYGGSSSIIGSSVLTWNSSGNVGIGTTTPEGKLTIQGTSAQPPTSGTTANSLLQIVGSLGGELNIGSNTVTGEYGSYIQVSDNNLAVSYPLILQPNGGQVGIGTYNLSSVGSALVVAQSSTPNILTIRRLDASNTGAGRLFFQAINASSSVQNVAFIEAGLESSSSAGYLAFASNTTERMRITSNGSIQMSNNSTTFSIGSIAGQNRIQFGTGGNTTEFAFINSADNYTPIGASAFNTRSDYRLKEDLKEFNGLSLISNIKVYDFKWKEKQERNYGFMAHELQEVLPYVVTGKKDGIFENEPQYQGMDASKIVPVLVKAIQELKAELDAFKA